MTRLDDQRLEMGSERGCIIIELERLSDAARKSQELNSHQSKSSIYPTHVRMCCVVKTAKESEAYL